VPYREHPPCEALAPYVTCFWQHASAGEAHRVLPDGSMDVLYEIGATRARVIGPMTRAIVTQPDGPACVVGVRFAPGAAVDLLGLAAYEVRDESAPVADVLGAHGRSLDACLAEARDAGTALRAIEAEVRMASARRPDARVARAVATLRATGGELAIPAVAARVGVGERQLERLFHERVGYGPKFFSRVMRLERSTRELETRHAGSIGSWARLAVDCGYADQAHLVREFRALTGVTPGVVASARRMSQIDNPARGRTATVGA
jgi:AraC-like DNA-binding protein